MLPGRGSLHFSRLVGGGPIQQFSSKSGARCGARRVKGGGKYNKGGIMSDRCFQLRIKEADNKLGTPDFG